jgi:hypothetical protein
MPARPQTTKGRGARSNASGRFEPVAVEREEVEPRGRVDQRRGVLAVGMERGGELGGTVEFGEGGLAEAYFALQRRGETTAAQARFLRRYMKYLTTCPLDARYDPARAERVFGKQYEFYNNVCRAFGCQPGQPAVA